LQELLMYTFRRKIPSLHKSHTEHQVSVSGGTFDRESEDLDKYTNSRSTLYKHQIRHMVRVSAYLHEVITFWDVMKQKAAPG